MIEKIKEIGKALECGCYHCALALTLTIPDICGQVAYPDMNSNRDSPARYRKWFDEYVSKLYQYPEEILPNGTDVVFNGYACYLLRCTYLHCGNFDLKEQNHQIKIISFQLHYDKQSIKYGGSISMQVDDDKFSIDIDVSTLCRTICIAATSFYDENKDRFTDCPILDRSLSNEQLEVINALFDEQEEG